VHSRKHAGHHPPPVVSEGVLKSMTVQLLATLRFIHN
jgi:hypothetical protein